MFRFFRQRALVSCPPPLVPLFLMHHSLDTRCPIYHWRGARGAGFSVVFAYSNEQHTMPQVCFFNLRFITGLMYGELVSFCPTVPSAQPATNLPFSHFYSRNNETLKRQTPDSGISYDFSADEVVCSGEVVGLKNVNVNGRYPSRCSITIIATGVAGRRVRGSKGPFLPSPVLPAGARHSASIRKRHLTGGFSRRLQTSQGEPKPDYN